MEPVLRGTDCAGCRSRHQSSLRRKWRPTGPSCRSSSATAVLQSPTSRCRSSSLPAGAQFTHPAHLGPWPANICGRQTLAKFKPDPPNPEQQKVVDNVRPTVAAASFTPAVLELPHLSPLDHPGAELSEDVPHSMRRDAREANGDPGHEAESHREQPAVTPCPACSGRRISRPSRAARRR